MRRKKKAQPHANHERWLVSYADFITLLFAFFVVMYATAEVDKQKVGKLALSIQVAFNELGVFPGAATLSPPPGHEPVPAPPELAQPAAGSGGADLAALQRELEKSLKPEIERKEVSVGRVPDGLVISLREVGFFDSGSAAIQEHSQDAFGRIAALLLQQPYRIRIEGHTDNVPIHNAQFASNWELSTTRATELVQRSITRYGFAPERLSAAGYAQYHPVATNDSVEGRAQNRRVDIVVLDNKVSAPGMGIGSSTETKAPATKPNPAKSFSQDQ